MALSIDDLLGAMANSGANAPPAGSPVPSGDTTVNGSPMQQLPKASFLGRLGDAMLASGGYKPVYQPMLDAKQQQVAMEDYTRNPQQAIDMLTQVNPKLAADLWGKQQDFQETQRVHNADIQRLQDAHESLIHQRALSLIGAATDDKTYQALKKQYERYYAANGLDPLIQLPDHYDPEAISATLNAAIAPEDQAKNQITQTYNQARIAAETRAENDRNKRAQEAEAGRMARARSAEAGRNQRAKDTASALESRFTRHEAGLDRRSKKGIAKPAIKFNPDGTRAVIH